MKVLISGALGHIGSYLIRKILKEKKHTHIIIIDNLSSQRLFSLFNLNSLLPNLYEISLDIVLRVLL